MSTRIIYFHGEIRNLSVLFIKKILHLNWSYATVITLKEIKSAFYIGVAVLGR